jgi:hypothetical protein
MLQFILHKPQLTGGYLEDIATQFQPHFATLENKAE